MNDVDAVDDVAAAGERIREQPPYPRWMSILTCGTLLAAACLSWMAWQRLQAGRRPVVVAVSHSATADQHTQASVIVQEETRVEAVSRDPSWLADQRLARFRGLPTTMAQRERPAVLPPEERWRLEFDPGLTIGDYAEQLDAIGVELAVIVDATTIEYATKLTDSKPKRRTGKREDENRLFLLWTRGDLVAADRVLLANAGINASDRVVLHFIPESMKQEAARLEADFEKREDSKIERTVFGLRETFRGYELYVKRQQERL